MTKLLVKLFIKNSENINDPKIRAKYGFLGGFVGIIVNLILFTLKLTGGIITSSIAIIADAFNNLSDAGSSVITLIGFKLSNKPADKEHPFGHGRFEYIAGLFVSIAIIIVGIELLQASIDKIIHPSSEFEIDIFSIVVLSASILLKIWMSLFNRKLGKIIASSTMKATAMDSISDVIATSTVLIGLIIGYYLRFNIDGYLGLVVAAFIIYTGVRTVKETIDPLIGKSPDEEFVKQIEEEVQAHEYIMGIHDLIIHDYGPGRMIISLHVEVPANEDILKMHDIIDNIEREIKNKYDCNVTIHMDPIAVNDELTIILQDKVLSIIKDISQDISMHDFRLVKGTTHTNLIFDVVVPFNFNLKNDELCALIETKIKELNPKYYVVIDIDH